MKVNKSSPIAFFCLEYAIEDNLPLYAGGLGVLAGDYLLESGKQGISFYGFGLFYHQHLTDPTGSGFILLKDQTNKPLRLAIDIKTQPVFTRVWTKSYGSAHLFLLDTNFPENLPEDREITKILYDPSLKNLLLQELVLGIGGIKLLEHLKVKPAVFHLNEGHTSFVLLGLLGQQQKVCPPKALIVATKHTIFSGAGIYITLDDFYQLLGYFCNRNHLDIEKVFFLGASPFHPNQFSTTKFLFAYSQKSNCVSQSHCFFEANVHPESPLITITNGINPDRWQDPGWTVTEGKKLTDEEIWKIHQECKREMLRTIDKNLNPESLTLVWARRITAYKRPLLIFSDLDKLANLVNHPDKPLQIIISGRTKEGDPEGLELEDQIRQFCQNPKLRGKVIFCPDYNLPIARKLVAGADVWLSTPEIGKEACSTSGMKSGINGVLQFSTCDGWITEVNWENIGWIMQENNLPDNLYTILEQQILPLYYQRNEKNIPGEWIKRMRKTRQLVKRKYTSSRMLNEYWSLLYHPRIAF